MSTAFDPQRGLVIVTAEIFGPSASAVVRLALDTGATSTLLNVALLVSLGYDPSLSEQRHQITTGSGVEFVPRVSIASIHCLGQRREDFSVVAHTLPSSANVDGLLGLNFFRGLTLTIDFRQGQLSLT